jgi:hypothetical protein
VRKIIAMLSCVTAAVIICVSVASGIPIPAMDLADLAQRSDLIAIGQIISIVQKDARTIELNGTPTHVRIMVGELRVDQSLKGAVNVPSLSFEFELPDVPLGYGAIAPMSYRMIFLKKVPAGYSFVSAYYPSVCAIPGVLPRDTETLDNITAQLAAVVQDLRADTAQKEEALYALRTLRIPAATDALKSALQEKSTDLQLIATGTLLERNDISGIQIAEESLTKRPPAIPSYLFHNVAYAISQGVRDERAIPVLARLLRLPEVETRRAAASALWHTHSDSAAPALVAALDDPDFEVRFYGVIGLAEITGQSDWHPNMEVFHGNEAKYLQHWRDWAQATYPSQQSTK